MVGFLLCTWKFYYIKDSLSKRPVVLQGRRAERAVIEERSGGVTSRAGPPGRAPLYTAARRVNLNPRHGGGVFSFVSSPPRVHHRPWCPRLGHPSPGNTDMSRIDRYVDKPLQNQQNHFILTASQGEPRRRRGGRCPA